MICFVAYSYRFIYSPKTSKQLKTTAIKISLYSMECITATATATATTTANNITEVAVVAETATTTTLTPTTDPYELKLYQMFQCCDTKHCGYLDEFSLRRLCGMLELHQKGAVLIDNLKAKGKLSHVTFNNFKEELLNFLGTELNDQTTADQYDFEATGNQNTYFKKQENENFHILDEHSKYNGDVINENKTERSDYNKNNRLERDEVNSEREISPKLVMGKKKYGRRSRPIVHTNDDDDLITTSDSELSIDEIIPIKQTVTIKTNPTESHNSSNTHRNCSVSLVVQRSCSQSDIPNNDSNKNFGIARSSHCSKAKYNGCKLKRCASLPAQKSIQNTKIGLGNGNNGKTSHLLVEDSQLVKFDKQQLSSSLESLSLQSITAVMDTARNSSNWELIFNRIAQSQRHNCWYQGTTVVQETLPRKQILDLWETAHVSNGNGILTALGFIEHEDDHINLAHLIKVMEDEMYGSLDDEPQITLMKACLVLQSSELRALRQSARQLCDENNKLRADNKDSNRRITLFTAEIDEIHASIEDATKKEIRSLETKHNEQIKELTQRLTNEHEFWTNLNGRLESRIKAFEQNEIKLKADLEFIQNENEELLEEQQKMRQQICELEKKNSELSVELNLLKRYEKKVQEMNSDKHLNNKHFETKNAAHDIELINLMEKISTLQMDNKYLRDKNDELIVEVESLNLTLNKMKMKIEKRKMDSYNTLTDDVKQTIKQENDTKKLEITISPVLNESTSDVSGEWLSALSSELNHNANNRIMKSAEQQVEMKEAQGETEKDKEIDILKNKLKELELQLVQQKDLRKENEQLSNTERSSSSPLSSYEERCHQLESSLEQMQRAYEDCEDYWQTKLNEERALFEKERQIYEEEQQENDKKFTELMEKVREYEEQFNKDGRLTPIEEKDLLEQQYVDLEIETNELRTYMQKCMEESSVEIERLKMNIKELQLKLNEQTERNKDDINVLRINIRKTSMEEMEKQNQKEWKEEEKETITNDRTNENISDTINLIGTTLITSAATINGTNTHTTRSYLCQQPPKVKNCETIREILPSLNSIQNVESNSILRNRNLSTSEISKFSTPPPNEKSLYVNDIVDSVCDNGNGDTNNKTQSIPSEMGDMADCESSSTTSSKQSFETHSIHSIRNEQQQHLKDQLQQEQQQQQQQMLIKSSSTSSNNSRKTYSSSPSQSSPSHGLSNGLKDELKRLKYFEIKLRDQIKNLSMQRDGLITELQQLHEAKPVLEKAYARTAHPSLMQKVNQLELKNRHLQNVIKQQQQYNESYMQQSWRQHQIELNELHGRLETQSALIAEQVQRLQSADILVKDLYVENSHLAAAVQRLEQQRIRVNFIQQQHQQQQQLLHHQQQHQQPSRTTTASCSGFTGNALN